MVGRIIAATAAALAAALLVPAAATALTMDWEGANAWPGTTATSHTITVDGSDIVITVSDPAGVIQHGPDLSGGPGSVSSNTFIDPASNGGASSLFLKTNGNTAAGTGSQYVTITYDFSDFAGGVTDVAFSIFDIDQLPLVTFFGFPISGFTDQVEIAASYQGTAISAPTVTAEPGYESSATWGWDATNWRLTGSGSAAENDDAGTAHVDFGSQPLDQLTLTYRNVLTQGQLQWIAFSALTFSRSPEPSTGVLVGLGLFLLGARRRRR